MDSSLPRYQYAGKMSRNRSESFDSDVTERYLLEQDCEEEEDDTSSDDEMDVEDSPVVGVVEDSPVVDSPDDMDVDG